MPRSTAYFKNETIEYISKNFSKKSKILDIGAGIGTYSDLLRKEGFINIDCVEVFEKYVYDYKLNEKYNNVFIGDVTELNIDFEKYDLIIFGDVLEHIEYNSSKQLLDRLNNLNLIIAIPFESEQEESFGNKFEIHLQSDLTFTNFLERFQFFYPYCLRFDYGVFINNREIKKIYYEDGERPLLDDQKKMIKESYHDYDFINIKNKSEKITENKSIEEKNIQLMKSKTTIVTGLWNMGRDKISESFKRGYDQYLEKFSELLKTDVCMYIFIDPSDEEFIWKYRKKENTVINKMTLDELKDWFNFTKHTNEIRKKEKWLSQSGWLPDSPQATLECYNPVVMSKMFMLNNVTIWNPFDSEYFFWIDAGITNTVHYGYFTHDKVFDKLPNFIDENKDFLYILYPYDGGGEIHGFERNAIAKYSNTDYVKFVCRGGFFGGKKQSINDINALYYSYLSSSLNEGLMGTEESIFTIILYNHPELITQYVIKQDGLIWPFFEELKKDKFEYIEDIIKKIEKIKVNESLYLIKVKDSQQFENLVKTLSENNPDLLKSTETYLINNSVENQNDEEYKKVCNVNRIKYSTSKDNEIITNFFEELKKLKSPNTSKVGLYVITFNSPAQFEILIKSMLEYDPDFINKPQKFLLDNSTDLSTTPRYLELCERYGFEHIKKDNIGIMGGRVFVAEHFNETDLNYYWFWEDDMALYPKKDEVCKNGFNRYVDSLYQKSMEIIEKENFDFLKISFTEFYGSNDVQFSWYNVPQEFRQKHWPEKSKLPVQGLDPNSPRTKFDEIHIYKGLPYITGQIYLSNWPILLNKEGNYKCYLETKWARPFEQTSMSYVFQETIKGRIKPGILLLTPIEHNRFHHYEGNLRKES